MKINPQIRQLIYWIAVLAVVILCIIVPAHHHAAQQRQAAEKTTSSKAVKKHKTSKMRTPIDYRKSSETIPYPDLKRAKKLWIKVIISKNRAYVYDGNKIIYTMYCSAGKFHRDPKTGKKVSYTPTGTFAVQKERGLSFYNPQEKSGANYYVSWRNHGSYLFHTVPIDKNGKYIEKEAAKLGKAPGSHGCVRLSIPDAQWLYNDLPVNTKVVIKP